ncbi:MAG TPA: hypothetical protein GX509_10445 [Firmicutes bacterium]|nr:hypothetical protein [Bacillota bacterium]
MILEAGNVFAAAIISALLAFGVNTATMRIIRKYHVRMAGAVEVLSVLEEVVKTGAAILFGATIVWTHAVFGMIEGLFDIAGARARGSAGQSGCLAAVSGTIGHFTFGLITAVVFSATSDLILSVAVSAAVHVIWNVLVAKILRIT